MTKLPLTRTGWLGLEPLIEPLYIINNPSMTIVFWFNWICARQERNVFGCNRCMLCRYHSHVGHIPLPLLWRKDQKTLFDTHYYYGQYIALSRRGWKAASIDDHSSQGWKLPQYSRSPTTIDTTKLLVRSRRSSPSQAIHCVTANHIGIWAACSACPLYLPRAVSGASIELYHQKSIDRQQDDCQLQWASRDDCGGIHQDRR